MESALISAGNTVWLLPGNISVVSVLVSVLRKRDNVLLGLRDRDFLTDEEVNKLTKLFPNYKILRYYCFENYLYHPDNISEIGLANFDKEVYKNEILAIKNRQFSTLIQKVSESRKSYEEFRDGGIKQGTDVGKITEALQSDVFEVFYPFLNFKDFCGTLINKYRIDKKEEKEKLIQTNWFKNQLKNVLS